MHLLTSRRFAPLFVTQFLGAFNDNIMKNALVVLITYRLAPEGEGNAQILVTLAAALFILPYFLFSATAGQFADKFDRAAMARMTKFVEIIVMSVAAVGFVIGNVYFLLFVLFALGVQATFFGPVKYALLPQHLREDELLAGNAYIEAGTFLAILSGTLLGGLLVLYPTGVHLVSGLIIGCAVLGYLSSRSIPVAPASQPQMRIGYNIVRESWRVIAHDRANKTVWRAILAISWFWLVGATFLSQFPTYAKDVLHADETVVTLFLTVFSVGIALGSLLCNKLLKGAISPRIIPYGAWGICLFGLDLFFASQGVKADTNGAMMDAASFLAHGGAPRILLDLCGIAVAGGVYIVPLYAIMQHESDVSHRARTIASNNIVNALFMVLASVATLAMLAGGFDIPHVFLSVSLATGLVALWFSRHSKSA